MSHQTDPTQYHRVPDYSQAKLIQAIDNFDASCYSLDHIRGGSLFSFLSFQADDIFILHTILPSGWAEVTALSSGIIGFVPKNYTTDFSCPTLDKLFSASINALALLSKPSQLGEANVAQIIAGVQSMLTEYDCLSRQSAAIRNYPLRKRNRKLLLAELNQLNLFVRASSVNSNQPPTSRQKATRLICKIIIRSVYFIDTYDQARFSCVGRPPQLTYEPESPTTPVSSSSLQKGNRRISPATPSTMSFDNVPISPTGRRFSRDIYYLANGLKASLRDPKRAPPLHVSMKFHIQAPRMSSRIKEVKDVLIAGLELFASPSLALWRPDQDDQIDKQQRLDTLYHSFRQTLNAYTELQHVTYEICARSMTKEYALSRQSQELEALFSSFVFTAKDYLKLLDSYAEPDYPLTGEHQNHDEAKVLHEKLLDLSSVCLDRLRVTVSTAKKAIGRNNDHVLDPTRFYPSFASGLLPTPDASPTHSLPSEASAYQLDDIKEEQSGKDGGLQENTQSLFGHAPLQVAQKDTISQQTLEEFAAEKEILPEGTNIVFKNTGRVKLASFSRLVRYLTSCEYNLHKGPDPFFEASFFLTFGHFATAVELAKQLIILFSKQDEDERSALVIGAFRSWLVSFWIDLRDKDALPLIQEFVCSIAGSQDNIPNASKLAQHVDSLRQALVKITSCEKQVQSADSNFRFYSFPLIAETILTGKEATSRSYNRMSSLVLSPPDKPSLGDLTLVSNMLPWDRYSSVVSIQPNILAQQLTIYMADIFIKIRPHELLAGVLDSNRVRFGSVTDMTKAHNELTGWVRYSILKAGANNNGTSMDNQATMLTIRYWILVAENCLKLNNFDSLMAIIIALQSCDVQKLKESWELVGSEQQDMLSKYISLMSCERNFSAYRRKVREVSSCSSVSSQDDDEEGNNNNHNNIFSGCIPYLGLVLTDLTFAHEGNKSLKPYDAEDPLSPMLINLDKYILVTTIVSRFARCQYAWEAIFFDSRFDIESTQAQEWICQNLSSKDSELFKSDKPQQEEHDVLVEIDESSAIIERTATDLSTKRLSPLGSRTTSERIRDSILHLKRLSTGNLSISSSNK